MFLKYIYTIQTTKTNIIERLKSITELRQQIPFMVAAKPHEESNYKYMGVFTEDEFKIVKKIYSYNKFDKSQILIKGNFINNTPPFKLKIYFYSILIEFLKRYAIAILGIIILLFYLFSDPDNIFFHIFFLASFSIVGSIIIFFPLRKEKIEFIKVLGELDTITQHDVTSNPLSKVLKEDLKPSLFYFKQLVSKSIYTLVFCFILWYFVNIIIALTLLIMNLYSFVDQLSKYHRSKKMEEKVK